MSKDKPILPKWAIITLFISVPLLIVSLILLSGTVKAFHARPAVFAAPASHLTDSIFAAQNTEYVPDEAYPIRYSFRSMPYQIDLPGGDQARVGNGMFVRLQDHLCLYVTEIKEEEVTVMARADLPKAFFSAVREEETTVQTVAGETGWLNGYELTYTYLVTGCVTEGGIRGAVHTIAYLMDDEASGRVLVIAAVTDRPSDEGLIFMQRLCEKELSLILKTNPAPG